ncbi:hypothetical protein BX616_004495, partial [Lobosporangium transversale]
MAAPVANGRSFEEGSNAKSNEKNQTSSSQSSGQNGQQQQQQQQQQQNSGSDQELEDERPELDDYVNGFYD